MNPEEKRSAPAGLQETREQANTAFTVEEDNEHRPLDKTEGRMNNGETGGAGKAEDTEEESK